MDWYLLNGEKGLYCCVLAIYQYYKHQFKAHLHSHTTNPPPHHPPLPPTTTTSPPISRPIQSSLINESINHSSSPSSSTSFELYFKSGIEWIQQIKKECEENSFNYVHFWELVKQNHSSLHKGVPKRQVLSTMLTHIDHQIRGINKYIFFLFVFLHLSTFFYILLLIESSNWDAPLSLLPHTLSLQTEISAPSPVHQIPSTILTPSSSTKLQTYLEQFHLPRLSQFRLIYSTELYGFALQSLYRRVDLLSPVILLIKCHEKYSTMKFRAKDRENRFNHENTIGGTESISIQREDTVTLTPSYHHGNLNILFI